MTHIGYKTLIGSYGGFTFYSPLMRNFKELTRKHYEKTLGHKMSIFSKITHKLVSFLLCYCCFQNPESVKLNLRLPQNLYEAMWM